MGASSGPPREAWAPLGPQNQLRRVSRCRLRIAMQTAPNLVGILARSGISVSRKLFLARNLAVVGAIYLATELTLGRPVLSGGQVGRAHNARNPRGIGATPTQREAMELILGADR